ncbi:MAG: sulfotransferase [Pseudomonadota bacterium]
MKIALKGLRSAVYDFANGVVGPDRTEGRAVFVTGNGRSGTSWLGDTLGYAPETIYYREPCHPFMIGVDGDAAEAVWTHLVFEDEGGGGIFEKPLTRAFQGHLFPQAGYGLTDYVARMRARPRVVVKDVASFVSVEWVAKRWNPIVVLIFRHPAAYAASVANLEQDEAEVGRFHALWGDRRLRDRFFPEPLPHLDAIATPLEATVASWSVRTAAVLQMHARHDDWVAVRYEELAADPVQNFRALYARLALDWTPAVEAKVVEKTTKNVSGKFATSRVSSAHIDAWRTKLTPNQVDRVRAVIDAFSLPIYAGDDAW